MPDDLRTFLRDLTALPGISGHEDAVSGFLARRLGQFADEITIDVLGNVIARFGPPQKTAIAVLAHIDTVGMLVKQINPDGTLGIVPIGGINLRAMPGVPVKVGDFPGVVGVRSQHQAQAGETALRAEDIYIHIGSGQDVEITTPITYATTPIELAGNYWSGPYLDNRAGCAVLLQLAQVLTRNLPCTVYLIGTVQEETTCQGARFALSQVGASAAIFVDGTVSYDTPETRGRGSVHLGKGPVLTSFLYISGLNGWHAHPKLRQHLKQVARDLGLPFQQDATHGLMSDSQVATAMGIPSAIVGLPMRGKHSPMEMVSLDDLSSTVRLLASTLERPLPNLERGI